MDYLTDIFRLVVEAIENERLKDPSAGFVKLRQTKENKLKNISLLDIRPILIDIQNTARVIKITDTSYPSKPEPKSYFLELQSMHDNPDKQNEYEYNSNACFTIKILETYKDWHDNYVQNIKIENLSYSNLLKIFDVVSAINDKLQLTASSDITLNLEYITVLPELAEVEEFGEPEKYRLDVLSYLKQEGIINDYLLINRGSGKIAGTKTKININVDTFNRFFQKIKFSYKQRPPERLSYIEPLVSKGINTVESNLELPPNTKWEDITIQFKDGHNVDIKIKDKTAIHSDYKTMGFEDTKSRKPNKQWEFLLRLAENNGEISWEKYPSGNKADIYKTEQDFGYESDENDSPSSQNKGFSIIKAPDKTKKTKQLLSQSLKAVFPIDGDPFFPYEEVKAYKIKIKLIP